MSKIGFDLQGGDNKTQDAITALRKFLLYNKIDKIFVYLLNNFEFPEDLSSKVTLIRCKELISHDDGILESRRKKNSTLMKALEDLKNKEIDGLISAGSSGPLVSLSYLILKTFKENLKPAFAPSFIGFDKKLRIALDVGANLSVEPNDLLGFAKMGSIYYEFLSGKNNPRVGLLNIGKEPKKGTDLYKETYLLLKENIENFVGNIEPNQILNADYDILISDGFSGNILLKSYEGAFEGLKNLIKKISSQNMRVKAGLVLAKPLYDEFASLSKDELIGGAIVLGVNELVIKVHGNANSDQLYGSLVMVSRFISEGLIKKLKESI